MSIIISPFLPFPDIAWWTKVSQAERICFDGKEHFEKMTDRNRYYISGSNGRIQLSIPLVKGRNQRTAMEDVQVSKQEKWQTQHWRTLVSVYKRSPFFDYYEPSLHAIFESSFTSLADFNLTTIQWLKKQLKLSFEVANTTTYMAEYDAAFTDLRRVKSSHIKKDRFPVYYQVFAERTGFLPNLSMLDLLFSEGPATMKWINDNRDSIG